MTTFVGFFLAALVLGSLVEYLFHRFVLHSRLRHPVIHGHKMHHKKYDRHSVATEFVAFFPPAIPLLWIGFVHSALAGIAFVAGLLTYVLAVAVVHKWSHEAPHRVFWMSPVVHAMHHNGARWNYGVVTPLWDRVFGTYRTVPAPRPSTGARS